MVEPTKKTVTEQIDSTTATPSGMDQNQTPDIGINSTLAVFREIQQDILDEIAQHLSSVNDPKASAKQQRDAVDALLRQLQTAIDEVNSEKTQ